MKEANIKLFNVIVLGLVFLLVFSGFNTLAGIQHLILNSAKDQESGGYVEGFYGNGLWSLATIFMVHTVANWIAPSVIAVTGPRLALFLGAAIFGLFKAQLLVLNTELLYASSALLGIGAAVLWTAQGNYLAQNSDEDTISRNSGIFWAMLNCSGLIGHIFVYFQFRGNKDIDSETRTMVVTVLMCMATAGTFVVTFLRPTPWTQHEAKKSPLQALKDSFKLFFKQDMLMLSFTFLYTGIKLNICFALYGTCIGFTNAFGTESKGLTNLAGIFTAIGEVLSSTILGLFGKRTSATGRKPIIILGFVVSMVAYLLIFLNLPNECPLGETDPAETAIIPSNKYLAVLAGFLLGFSDAIFNTQAITILGSVFAEESASAFMIYKFLQSLAASAAFWYSPVLKLYWQLLIATTINVANATCLWLVEKKIQQDKSKNIKTTSDNTAEITNYGMEIEESF